REVAKSLGFITKSHFKRLDRDAIAVQSDIDDCNAHAQFFSDLRSVYIVFPVACTKPFLVDDTHGMAVFPTPHFEGTRVRTKERSFWSWWVNVYRGCTLVSINAVLLQEMKDARARIAQFLCDLFGSEIFNDIQLIQG